MIESQLMLDTNTGLITNREKGNIGFSNIDTFYTHLAQKAKISMPKKKENTSLYPTSKRLRASTSTIPKPKSKNTSTATEIITAMIAWHSEPSS